MSLPISSFSLFEIQENAGQKMTSDHRKKNARNARRRRLQIRQMKSHTGKGSECGRCFPRWRNIAFKEVPSREESAESMKDVMLKGAVGNMSSGISLPSPSPSESPDHSFSSLTKGQIEEKGQVEKDESSEEVARLKCGSVSLIGRRRAMEDAVTVAPGMLAGKYAFFAAYDGHGGDRVANACREGLHKLLENELETNSEKPRRDEPTTSGGESGKVDWKKVMAACFSRMDDEVLNDRYRTETGAAEETVGSTAVVVMVGNEEVVVGNCGDSRAVLCRGGVAMPLSNDHKPERPDEKDRVEAAGGRIIDWNGCRVQGVLSTSRSIGDHYLKPYVISEPEVTVTRRMESDEFLIIATDGLWDVVSNEFACEVVRRCLEGRIRRKSSSEHGAAEAAAILAELAVAKGSRDNISVIVVELKTKL